MDSGTVASASQVLENLSVNTKQNPDQTSLTTHDKKAESQPPQQPDTNPELSEIRNIAYHVQPPTVQNSRTTPLTNHLKRTDPFQFGSRYLEATDDVFSWNAWDHVDPSQDSLFVSYAASQYAFQKEHQASDFDKRRFNADPEKWWNKFYSNNEANFFKDRKWLRQEFPVLGAATQTTHEEVRASLGAKGSEEHPEGALEERSSEADVVEGGPWNVILEIGAGAGNTAFPLVKDNKNPDLMVHACDFSSKAVKVMKESELYNPKHMVASQWDMAAETLPEGLTAGSVDVVVLIFAFSALSPVQWRQAVQNVWDVLRPGGEVCFRDYGRGDLAQVRFKKGRWLGENFYVRGDGTRVYFFEEEELRGIWSGRVGAMAEYAQKAQLEASEPEGDAVLESKESLETLPKDGPGFEIVSLATDRRLLVNRQKQLKMYRCWQQARFRKPAS